MVIYTKMEVHEHVRRWYKRLKEKKCFEEDREEETQVGKGLGFVKA